jgi:hypothetical protein|tara:strand:- start:2518 stop:2934 length:417 start_codon:yes stop_codon:yes gene_type:complete
MSYKGRFKPQNPKKYKGDPNNVIYRSSWELRVMKYLDNQPKVEWWASEEMFVRYRSPIDERIHRYYPDFVVKTKEKTFMLEVKPFHQTQKPKQKRKTKKFLQEAATYAVNQQKWRAADMFCQEHGWLFKLVTEKDLGI